MTLYFSHDDKTDEANHWTSLMLGRAIRSVDERFGDGYAEKNPALTAAYLQAGMGFIRAKMLEDSLSGISGSIGYISEEIAKIDLRSLME
jgi:hypothetical protein